MISKSHDPVEMAAVGRGVRQDGPWAISTLMGLIYKAQVKRLNSLDNIVRN